MEDGFGGSPSTERAQTSAVLILVLMEDGFGEPPPDCGGTGNQVVLILVLMEDGFGDERIPRENWKLKGGLNPCFNGRWFRSRVLKRDVGGCNEVLILVLMEDGFGEGELYE